MLTVTREDLLNSKPALDSLCKVYLPVGKEKYWLVKTVGKIMAAWKREAKARAVESDRLVKLLGSYQKNPQGEDTKRFGISPDDTESMEKYHAGLNEFTEQPVSVDVATLTLGQLQENSVTLTIGDQLALSWLLIEG